MSNRRSDYYRLLADAFYASEEVDVFDVGSEDPDSERQFRHLQQADAKAQLDLIGYVIEHQAELAAAFGSEQP